MQIAYRYVSLLLLVLIAAPRVLAQSSELAQIVITQPPEVSSFPNVSLYATVQAGRQTLTTFGAAQWNVIENGTRIADPKISVEATGTAMVLLLDISASMMDSFQINDQAPLRNVTTGGRTTLVDERSGIPMNWRLWAAVQQARAMVDQVGPNNWVSLVTFGTDATVVEPLTLDHNRIQNALTQVMTTQFIKKESGQQPGVEPQYTGSALYSAVDRALEMFATTQASPLDAPLRERLPHMTKSLVVLSDGGDTVAPEKAERILQTLGQQRGLLDVYALGFGSPDAVQIDWSAINSRPDFSDLKRLSEVTGGSFIQYYLDEPTDVNQLADRLGEIMRMIVGRAQQYRIEYTSALRPGLYSLSLELPNVAPATTSLTARSLPPQIRLPDGLDGATIQQVYTIRPIVTGNNVEQVEYFIDGESVAIKRAPPYEYEWNIYAQNPEGKSVHTLKVLAKNTGATGAVAESPLVTVTVDPDPLRRPTPTAAPPASNRPAMTPGIFLRDNAVSLLILLTIIGLAVFFAKNPQAREKAATVSKGVTGVLGRMTGVLTTAPSAMGESDAVLLIRPEIGGEQRFPLGGLITFIGASSDLVDLVLTDTFVSGRHASITRDGSRLLLVDLASRNGTLVNGQRIPANEPVPLQHGDKIKLGQTELEVLLKVPAPISVPTQSAMMPSGVPTQVAGMPTSVPTQAIPLATKELGGVESLDSTAQR